jgi:hypothetical protein
VHRGKNLLVTDEIADLLDPICRAEITRMRAADPGWRRLLDHLADAGPASLEDLRTELRLKRQELNALRAPLERCGAILARSLQVTAGEGHQHSSELIRWDQAHPAPGASHAGPHQALADLIAAAVHAAVVAPERELRRWSPGSGTGQTGSSTACSVTAGCAGSAVTSPRQRDQPPTGRRAPPQVSAGARRFTSRSANPARFFSRCATSSPSRQEVLRASGGRRRIRNGRARMGRSARGVSRTPQAVRAWVDAIGAAGHRRQSTLALTAVSCGTVWPDAPVHATGCSR